MADMPNNEDAVVPCERCEENATDAFRATCGLMLCAGCSEEIHDDEIAALDAGGDS